ncbi:hypothetical protein A3C37_04115 [Candidatus Peribacteria bacterium RIFCSPHIGHO2_02_FULL_53_20]|nr:MAG: hypothetical protein A3C37_04115 [Candidatus Peribacteria bacterium RIFCSPHIGHO2_02_FULL_53_20]OGJ67019.1 MAG: hypothetical protein A3B61_04680 [Candidatus Peribacteria bacterium RIFCSPLOWO2_01_FULL_53_10]OGJ74730.1 MAG: hypothetical protein A3G69_04835 [Candidatus Peribacteria bacterium RIFCSPLOWO2_12_FULL_53_10]OGZ14596.1 MAG: hypothetical protein A3H76_04720 [Candidatus Lloydbacteria bacterium RIFCSPLOWO2_02_FULL_54_12]
MHRAAQRDHELETLNGIISREELRRIRQDAFGTTCPIPMRKERIPKQLSVQERRKLEKFYNAHRVTEYSDVAHYGTYHIARRIFELLGHQALSERLVVPSLEDVNEESPVDNIIVAGTACSGKNNHASRIATALGRTFIDIDDFVAGRYLQKMKRGIPPTTEDRLSVYITALHIMHLMNETGRKVVLIYPAQKQVYRDLLRTARNVRFVLLHAPKDVLLQRARRRKHPIIHGDRCEPFIEDQVRILEMPTGYECMDTVSVSTDAPENKVQKIIQEHLHQWLFANAKLL